MASDRPQRKLAAILAADVVGYSRLAGADEDRTLARLRGLRSDLIDPAIAAHHGRIVKRTGDGAIVEFRSAVDAVRCAIEVQNGLIERNAGVAEDRRIEFRVGIHVGDVVEESDGDLMGDGVNIAARLQGVAMPGAICLSEDAYRQVKQRLDLRVIDLGATHLKNIAEPIHVYCLEVGAPGQSKPGRRRPRLSREPQGTLFWPWPAVAATLFLALAGASAYLWQSGLVSRILSAPVAENRLNSAPHLSIVVLPFANLSGDPEQDYFADGITDDLTTDLSRILDSFVIARNTAMTYKGKPIDVKEIGRELGVRYALEGSVRRIGDKVTVNAQLISTATGAHIWADRFEGDRAELGALQSEFVARIANALGAELTKAESARATLEHPDNPDALDLAMRARQAAFSGATKEAIEGYEQALKLDPGLTRAQYALSMNLIGRAQAFGATNREADIDRAEKLADQALAARPDNAQARLARANVLVAKNQIDAAILEAESAIESDHNYAFAYGQLALWRALVGHAEHGLHDAEMAIKLSPRDPGRPTWDYRLCHLHIHLAHWEQAIPSCQQAVASNSKDYGARLDLAAAYAWLGREAEAKVEVGEILKLNPSVTVKGLIKYTALFSDNPIFTKEIARWADGLRKAGLPEQ
jgi:TolB-like protein/class 3 adenylate cyclase